jgi:hypothetical protein
MDMSAAYWQAVQQNLREAAVVFDKIHIVKAVNDKLDQPTTPAILSASVAGSCIAKTRHPAVL